MSKRPGSPEGTLIKRARFEDDNASTQQMVVSSDGTDKRALVQTVKRTSGLQAPIMCLQGHQAEILDLQFSPDGESLASASSDKTISFWKVYGECKNYGTIKLKTAPTALAWLSNEVIVAACADHTVTAFSVATGEAERRFRGHRDIVNCLAVQRGAGGEKQLVASGSDDGTVRVWSLDRKDEVYVVSLDYAITALQWSEDGTQLYLGGLDNCIHAYTLATEQIAYSLHSHTDTITSLALHPSQSQLVSCGMDSAVHLWNTAPFAPSLNTSNPALPPRLVRSFFGAPSGFENLLRKVSLSLFRARDGKPGSMIACGGADRTLTVWDTTTGEILYKLPGHTGTVVATAWSPREPIVASGGVEGAIYLGEVEPK